MDIQKMLTKNNFPIYLFINLLSYAITFWLFPTFLTFTFLSAWTLFSVIIYWLFVLNVPINFITVLILFLIKSFQKKQALVAMTTEICSYNNVLVGVFLLLCIGGLFLIVKNTEKYKNMSTFNQELNSDEKIVAAHLKEDVTFFGSTKEQLICSFFILNGCCFCNETTALDLLVSEVEDVRLLAVTYAFFFSLTLIYTLILEVYVIFYFNHPTEHPLFLATKRLGKLVVAGAVNAYTFDRVCLSGDWDPPTSFGFVRDYQVSKLGCVATTKKALKSLTQYKDLGIKEPLPLIGDTKNLDVEILNDRIQTRVLLLEFYAKEKKKALAAASMKYDISLSGDKNLKKFDLLAPPQQCPPGESPDDVKYDYNHIDRVVARFNAERESKK